MDDSELVAKARRGDTSAFEVLVARHQSSARRTASLVAGTSDVDDVVQEALIKALTMLEQLRGGAAFRGWLLAIVANQARAHLRSVDRRRTADVFAAHLDTAVPSAETLAINGEQRRVLLAAVAELRPEERQVLGYRFFQGLSEAETARAVKCPTGTVKSRLSRAVGRLRANPLLEEFLERLPRREEEGMGTSRTDFDVALERAWENLGEAGPDSIARFFGEKTGWWIGGSSTLAGEYRGEEQVLGYFRQLVERSGGTYNASGVDVSSTDYHSFLCYLSTATIDGETLSWHETVVMHRDGELLGDCFVYFYDQNEFDQFWGAN